MSKLFFATALMSLLNTAQMQVASASPTSIFLPPENRSTPSQPTRLQPPDLALLGKAVAKFWQTDRAKTKSELVLHLKNRDLDTKIYAQIETIVQTGDRFLTNLVFSQPGSTVKNTYTIVSNGKNVWIYSPNLRQYAKTSLSQFRADNSLWIGQSSSLFISITESKRRELISSLNTNRDLSLGNNSQNIISAELQSLIQDKYFQGERKIIDREDLYMYSYKNQDDNSIISGYVRPGNATIHTIESSSKEQGTSIEIVERTIARNSQVNLTNRTFRFLPPRGVKQVKSLEIVPLTNN